MEHHEDFPLLLNPDDFMPDDYDVGHLEHAASRVKDLLGFCSRKSVKYVDNNSVLDFSPTSTPEGLPADVHGVRTLEHARQRIDHKWTTLCGNIRLR